VKRFALLLGFVVAGCDAASPVQREPELVSPLGRQYFALDDTARAIAQADSALREDPSSLDGLLAAAAARASLWQYRAAIEFYDSAIAHHPSDWRAWRFRGHRHISLRRFDQAVQDLEQAWQRDSLSFDVAYHLGLAHYLAGQFDEAAEAYARCMDLAGDSTALALRQTLPAGVRSCMNIADIDNDRVAITEWRWRALRRAGRHGEADELLQSIRDSMDVGTNASYHQLLLMHKGAQPATEVFDTTRFTGNQFETIGYGVAVQWLTEGDTARALDLMNRIVERGDRWQAFGFIAAERDLVTLGGPTN
jgi:tetratricopeptide (TPR) repeat protein